MNATPDPNQFGIQPLPIAADETVTVRDYLPPTAAKVVAIDAGKAWVRWPNGISAVVKVTELRRAG